MSMFGKKEDRQPAASVELMPLSESQMEEIEEEIEEEIAEEEQEEEVAFEQPEAAAEDNFEMVYDPESPVQFSAQYSTGEEPAKDTDTDFGEVNLWNVLRLLIEHKADDFLLNYVPDYSVNKDVTASVFETFHNDKELLECFNLYLHVMYNLKKGDIVKVVHTIGGTDSEPAREVESAAVVINRPANATAHINAIEVYDIVAGETFTLDESLKIVAITGLEVSLQSFVKIE